ncbi:MAG: hypothetical protein KC912_07965 [Proteobacteria bacterium]|nr:hypothetical protein [Pseudomonadota bacterium]
MATSPSKPGAWAYVRAAFIAFHLVAISLMAMPAPGGGMSRSAWKDPTVQAEFRAWTDRVNAMGADVTQQEFEDRLWDFATGFMKARTKVLAPLGPYFKYTGAKQSWRMFVAPHRFPARLEFRVRIDGDWQTIYRARSDEYTWLGTELDHDRMRSAQFRYGWSQYAGTYRRFSDHYAARALEDYPDADAFMSVFYKYRTLSPEEARSGMDIEGRYISARVVNR